MKAARRPDDACSDGWRAAAEPAQPQACVREQPDAPSPGSCRQQLHVWLTREEALAVQRAAAKVDRSVSSLVRSWIRGLRLRESM